MLLGAIDVTPMEAAQMYNGLANGGFRTPLRAVRTVLSEDGKTLYFASDRPGGKGGLDIWSIPTAELKP